jgi:ABC-type branched-subunit amino acid transport system substrate-binding protein
MRHRPRWRAAAAATGLLLVTATGCSTGRDGLAAACSTPGVSPHNIKIGLLFPDTGTLSGAFAPARSGVEARVGLANATGGVHGRQIDIEWRDDQTSPTVNERAARDLVENAGVFGIIEQSAVAAGSADYLDAKQIPVTGIVTEPVWSRHRNMFNVSNPYSDGPTVTTFGQYAKRQGGTRAYLLQSALTAASRANASKFATSLTSQGIELVGTADYTEGATSPASVAADIKRLDADVIVALHTGTALASVVQAARAAGVEIKAAFGPGGYDQALIRRFGTAIAGMAVFVDFLPFEARSLALDAYRNAIARYAPELDSPDQVTAIRAYLSADLFVRGLAGAGSCPTRTGFIESLRAVTDYDGGGLLPETISLQETFDQPNRCYFFVRVNAAATGFDVVPGGSGPNGSQWCGDRLPTG